MNQLRLPEALNIDFQHLRKTLSRSLHHCYITTGVEDKLGNVKTSVILNCAGSEIIEVSKHFEYDENESKEDPAILMRKIEQFCNPQKNKRIGVYKFWKLSWSSESFGQLLNI